MQAQLGRVPISGMKFLAVASPTGFEAMSERIEATKQVVLRVDDTGLVTSEPVKDRDKGSLRNPIPALGAAFLPCAALVAAAVAMPGAWQSFYAFARGVG